MITLVRKFFRDGTIVQGLNETNVVLISKNKSPTKFTDLRPISLYNVLLKIITKVMTNRLKEVLEDIVSENRSAYIPAGLITDNIMVSYEMRRRGKEEGTNDS